MLVAVGVCLFEMVIHWRFLNFLDLFDFLELMQEVEVLVWWRWPEVWGSMWEVGVWTLVRVLIRVVEEMIVETWVLEGLDGGFVTGFPRLVESSGKTS